MLKIMCSVAGDTFFYTARFALDVGSSLLDRSNAVISRAEHEYDRRMWDWTKASVTKR